MKIFISWSGERSKEIASAFKEWIPAVIQAARPYFSPSDIDKGSRWSTEISKELESATVGLICLTKENLNAPWLMFEAGALSKSMEKSRVCPMLFGLDPSDLTGPLVQFQATVFSKEEVLKLVRTVNQQLESQSLDPKVLDSVFEKWWPDLAQRIEKVMQHTASAKDANVRSEREILEEILALSRTLATKSRPTISAEEGLPEVRRRSNTQILSLLVDYGTTVLIQAKDAVPIREFLDLYQETLKIVWAALSESDKLRVGTQARKLNHDLQARATQLEDEAPF